MHVSKRLLVLLNLVWLSIVSILLLTAQDMRQGLLYKNETIKALSQEIRWQRYEADRAKARVASLPELEYMAGVFEMMDQNLHAVAKAAWKYGRQYNVSPFLIMSVAHRESNFDRFAVSMVNGTPCAYGIMQINASVWKPDMARIFEVDYNVQHGTIILRHYLDRNPGDVSKALWEYWGRGESYSYSPRVLASKYFDVQG